MFQSPTPTVAVLLGGGVESTLLVERYLDDGREVVPVHIHCGLIWDDVESEFCRRFCRGLVRPNLASLIEVHLSLRETLGEHWATTGRNVPLAGAPSADLEIPLRNLTLLTFAWHAVRNLGAVSLALGTTSDNNYRDGSREYFDRCEQVLSLEADRPVSILTPFITWDKQRVIRESRATTLEASFSCVHPQAGRHCGRCIKCGKRQASFQEAGVPDLTHYAD